MADGNADWGLYHSGLDALTSTIDNGQDRQFLQAQRQAAIQKQQDDAAQQATAAAALPGIRTQLEGGNYNGAQISAAFTGNQPIADFIGGLHKEHQAALGDMATTLGSTAYGLKNIADPTARQAAFDAAIPALKVHGIDDATIAQARGNLTDQALDGYINSAQTVQQHVASAQHTADQQFELSKPYTMAPGDVRKDGVTNATLATSPYKPEVHFVSNADGSTTPVTIDYNQLGGAGGGSVTPSPAGAGTRPQRNNNPGNVRALPNGQQWRGQTGTDDGGYAVFGDQASGERAADRNLQSYGRRGINTVAGIVSRWAPKADRNNTDAYIASVSRALGIAPNQPVDLTDPNVRSQLLSKGIYPNEGPRGQQPNAPRDGTTASSNPGISYGQPIGAPTQPGNDGTNNADTIHNLALQTLANGGKMPPIGMGKAATQTRSLVNNEVTNILRRRGQTGADLGVVGANIKADTASLTQLQKNSGIISTAEQTFLANAQQYLNASKNLEGQSSIPGVNAVTNFMGRHLGSTDTQSRLQNMDITHDTALKEYGRIVDSSPTGAGTLAASAVEHNLGLINSNAPYQVKQTAIQQLRIDAENRRTSNLNNIAQVQHRIRYGADFANVPQSAIDHLKSQPSLAPAFDAKYGRGFSSRVLD